MIKKHGLTKKIKDDIFFLILRRQYIGLIRDLRLNMSNLRPESWTPLSLITLFYKNYFLLNFMKTKIDAHEIEHKLNIMIVV